MRIGRTLPPAAAPIPIKTILRALPACFYRSEQGNETFERELKEYFNVKHCFLLSSGKAALFQILLALKKIYPDRDEVLVPAFTCYSVPASIKRAGLKIKLCDIAPSSLDYDKVKLQEIVFGERNRKKLLCVVVTHLFGCPADFAGIRNIVGQDIPIVEDAAQAMGEELDKKKLGTLGDIGFFSLGRGKSLSTMEGGVIVTSRNDLGEKIGAVVGNLTEYGAIAVILLAAKAILTNVMIHPLLFWIPKSITFLRLGETIYDINFKNLKFSKFQRKLAKNWQYRLGLHLQNRKKKILYWQISLANNFENICRKESKTVMIRLPFLALSNSQRKKLLDLSEKEGFGMMPGYPDPINAIPEIAEAFSGQKFPNAQDISERIFSLPTHEFIDKKDIERISHSLIRKKRD